MITSEVTKEELNKWKTLFDNNRDRIVENRISGNELNAYFCANYVYEQVDNPELSEVVTCNARENGSDTPLILTYIVQGNIYVGIDLETGYFHVESEDTAAMVRIWDDLFIRRGLNKKDLENYIIVGQYLSLLK